MDGITPKRVLLVEDDSDYRRTLRPLLELEGYEVEEASSVEMAKSKLENGSFDLVLSDLRLTDNNRDYEVSGLDVARSATARQVPCIIITAYDTSDTARLALRSRGAEPLADDYVPKKVGPQAVLDAISAVLQRRKQLEPSGKGLTVDLNKRSVFLNGAELALSEQQYDLLAFLYRNSGTVCSHEELVKAVYNEELSHSMATTDKRLERLIARLREKIEDDPTSSKLLNIPGRGFRLDLVLS